jgi:hypothetical protein
MNASRCKTLLFAGLLIACAARADAQFSITCDVTGNGTISSLDASYVLQFVAGMRTFTPNQQVLADATGNGSITAFDATRILQASTGKVMPGSLCGTVVQLP